MSKPFHRNAISCTCYMRKNVNKATWRVYLYEAVVYVDNAVVWRRKQLCGRTKSLPVSSPTFWFKNENSYAPKEVHDLIREASSRTGAPYLPGLSDRTPIPNVSGIEMLTLNVYKS